MQHGRWASTRSAREYLRKPDLELLRMSLAAVPAGTLGRRAALASLGARVWEDETAVEVD